jgi:hypothetical protein
MLFVKFIGAGLLTVLDVNSTKYVEKFLTNLRVSV